MKFTLQRKIHFAVLGIVSILSLFSMIFFPERQKRELMSGFQREVADLAEAVSLAISIGMDSGDSVATQSAIKFASSKPGVRFVALVSGGKLLAASPAGRTLDTRISDSDTMLVRRAPLVARQFRGEVVVGRSTAGIRSGILSIRLTAVAVSCAAVLFGFLSGAFLAQRVSAPIMALDRAAKQISAGQFDTRVAIESSDEIGALGMAFNSMAENLQKLMAELKASKTGIEQKVEEAVARANEEKRYLATSVETLLRGINQFASGDLTVRIDTPASQDAIGMLFRGVNHAIARTYEVLCQVGEAAGNVSNAGKQISVAAGEMRRSAGEQSQQTLEVASAIEEMNKTISENAENAGVAARTAEKSGLSAREGGEIVANSIKAIKQIAAVVKQSANTVQSLSQRSEQIDAIVQVINDIADQTNLLALNAAIEAARAGENGRGFAVVADEVRKLAERTTASTKEIANMIQQIQSDTETAVKIMNKATKEVDIGKSLIDRAGVSLQSIIDDSDKVIEVITLVASASDQQATTSAEIARNVENISRITQRQFENTSQISGLADELEKMMNTLRDVLSQFRLEGHRGAAESPAAVLAEAGPPGNGRVSTAVVN